MITVIVTDEQRERAEKLYSFGRLNNSIMRGKSNIYGAIGEVVFFDHCREMSYEVELVGDYDYDVIIEGIKVDVKTKRTTVRPKQNYYCSVAAVNISQKCDYYIFVRVMEDKEVAYILGGMDKDGFFSKAAYFKKGQKDPDKPEWTFRDNCYNLPISDLRKLKYENHRHTIE